MLDAVLILYLALLGLLLGSFAGCLGTRHRAGLSVVSPARSMCLRCGAPLHWFDNVPLVSYLLLRGRCRHCGGSIGARLFVVEAALGVGSPVLALVTGSVWGWAAGIAVLFCLAAAFGQHGTE
ncbi:MAG: prepilin peptidase [Pseudodesulfovibrio sp.]